MPAFNPEAALDHLSQADEQFAALLRRVGMYALKPRRGTIFEGLLKSIVYQQLSGKAAGTIYQRLLKLLPARAVDQPRAILALTDEELRSAGLSRAKAAAVRDLAARTISGAAPNRRQLTRLTDEEVIARLIEIRGVGRWTAEMILIFSLGRPDVLPAYDLGVRRGFAITYGLAELPSPQEVLERGAVWAPYRSVAAWYLWRAADLQSAQPLDTW